MFYIIEAQYVGPNQLEAEHRVMVCLTPLSGEDAEIEGWCTYSHGSCETIEDARSVIAEKFGATSIDEFPHNYDIEELHIIDVSGS